MVLKRGTVNIRVVLPVLGFLCFLVFQFLKSHDDSAMDVNTFLKSRLTELVQAFDEDHDGVITGDEVKENISKI